jgi:hypothetical protein
MCASAAWRWAVVNTLCQGEDSVQHQLVLFQVYHNFILPHASLRQPLVVPASDNG